MRIVISGGGTGGHIYPAIALIEEIKKKYPDTEFLYIGTEKGLESNIVKREGIPFQPIKITGFRRKLSLQNLKTILLFINGTLQSKKIIKQFNPDVVIGTGGYVCGPVVFGASRLNVPTIIHEQNSVPGLTNKFLSRYVDKVATSFLESKEFFPERKVFVSGNPRASVVINQKGKNETIIDGLDPNKKTVLVVGGSRGAKPINDAFLALMHLKPVRNYQFLYVTGDVHYDEVVNKIAKIGNPKNVIIKPFIHNMPEVLANVDLIVARAGATTLAEITALGLPSILIPSPYVTNNHQEKNARALGAKGAAIVRLEKELTGESLLTDIDQILLDSQALEKMKEASKEFGIPDASSRFIEAIETLVKQRST